MKKFNDNTIIATGLEIHSSGDFVHFQPTDSENILWIKQSWDASDKKPHFAPVTEVFTTKQENSTHKIKSEEFYISLHKVEGKYAFENFINGFVEIEELVGNEKN